MQVILIATTLAVGVASDSSISGSGDLAPTVTEILDVWSRRADSVKSGEIRWTIPREHWNRFGRFETEWVSASGPAGREITGTVRFDGQRMRYDSVSFSYVDFGKRSRHLRTLPTERESYRKNLFAGFRDQKAEYRDLLPYTVIYLPTRRIHFWRGSPNEYPRAVVLPAEPKNDSLSLLRFTALYSDSAHYHSGGPSAELHHLLVAPTLLTFRPSLFDGRLSQAEACHIVDGPQPVYEGRVCCVLRVLAAAEANHSGGSAAPPERVYWVDPSRDFLVVRCMAKQDDAVLSQIDIQYEQVDDSGWIPSKWTALRFGARPNIVRQVVTAVRTHIDFQHAVSDAQMDLQVPPGTWVVDTVTPRQYLVRDDLSEYETRGESRFSVYTHKELVARSQGRTVVSFRSKKIRRVLSGLISWPGVLIPVTLISGILIVTNRLLARRKNARRCPAAAENRSDSRTSMEEIEG